MPSEKEIKKPEFWKPSVATDLVAFAKDPKGDIRMLLITRGRDPFKGGLAYPGGFLSEDDTDLEECAVRELREETGALVKRRDITLLAVRSGRDRDPRQNRVISVSYLYIHAGAIPVVKGADDAAHAEWVRVKDIDPTAMAFDHTEIYKTAVQRLKMDDTLSPKMHWFELREQLSTDQQKLLGV